MAGNGDQAPQAKHFPSVKRPLFAPGTFNGKIALVSYPSYFSPVRVLNIMISLIEGDWRWHWIGKMYCSFSE